MASADDIKKQFGLRLKELRAEHGISQDAFAYSIGMARTYYSEVEVGKRNLSLENIKKIADGFDITLAEFFDSEIFTAPKVTYAAMKLDAGGKKKRR